MLLEAILGIIAISVVFCCCTLCCYVLFHYIFTEDKADLHLEPEVFEAKHFYDPLPMATPSPPDTIFKPTPYTFKLQNGNGVYSSGLPHAVINPAVLQYPPGHIYDQQRVHPPPAAPPTQEIQRKEKRERLQKQPSYPRHSKSHSRSPSPSPGRSLRGTINVWSTNTEFQQPRSYYHQNPQRYQFQQQQQNSLPPPSHQRSQKQSVQLTQEHYPLEHLKKQQQYENMHHQQSDGYYHHQRYDEYEQTNQHHNPHSDQHNNPHNNHHRDEHNRHRKDQHNSHHNDEHNNHHSDQHNRHRNDQHNSHHNDHHSDQHNGDHRQNSQHFEAFLATTHATNAYTPSNKRKLYRSKSRIKEDIT